MKVRVQLFASVMALAVAMPVHAQSAGQSSDGSGEGLQEIIVTAQRREQSQQSVPIAISTISSANAKLFNTVSTDTLAASVPGFQLGRESALAVTPFLRGVGSTEAAGAEGEVAVYVDDVYIGNSQSTDFQFNNIDSIEVLKGPQGTLFGRNATGGVVHIHTKDPAFTPSAIASIGYGNFNTIDGNFYGNLPLSDTVAVNFAATGHDQRRGFGKQFLNGQFTGRTVWKGWNYAFRGKLLWQPTETTRVLLSADHSELSTDIGGNMNALPGTLSIAGGTYPGKYISILDPEDLNRNHSTRVSGKINQGIGNLDLISITAYQKARQHFMLDIDGSPLTVLEVDAHSPTSSFSQEVQLQSNQNKKWTWILGGFYYHNSYCLCQNLLGSALAGVGGSRFLYSAQKVNSYSAFADTTLEILPDTRLTGGVRYTRDSYKSRYQYLYANGATFGSLPNKTGSSSKVTYRAVLDHHFTPDVMAYASYSTGFKSGRFDASSDNLVKPENLTAYEVGLKSEFFDHKARFNISGFYYRLSNMQVSQNVGGLNSVFNAARARIYGIDADLTLAPTKNLQISLGGEILNPKYVDFPNAPYNPSIAAAANPPAGVTCPLPLPTTGNVVCTQANAAGANLPQAPEFTMNASVTYTIPSNVGDFDVNSTFYHNSGFPWQPDNLYNQPAYDLLTASITWHSKDGMYKVRAYGNNLLNSLYYSTIVASSLGATASPNMPRSYGAEFTVRF